MKTVGFYSSLSRTGHRLALYLVSLWGLTLGYGEARGDATTDSPTDSMSDSSLDSMSDGQSDVMLVDDSNGEPFTPDRIAAKTVAFFSSSSCPSGWSVFEPVRGRIPIGAWGAMNSGLTVEAPMKAGEDRKHKHSYSDLIALPSQPIAAANGGNHQAAAKGTYPVVGDSSESSSGLPFLPVLACEKLQ